MRAGNGDHTRHAAHEPCPRLVGIIDDDDSVRMALDRLLRVYGHRTILFESAGEFLASGRTDAPDCLVVDYHMPGMNGLELIRALARVNQAMPIVMVTADADRLQHVATQTRVVAVLSKPVEPVLLLNVLRTILLKCPGSYVEEC